MALTEIERGALSALDEQKLIDALRDLLRIQSVTGQEATAQHWLSASHEAARSGCGSMDD